MERGAGDADGVPAGRGAARADGAGCRPPLRELRCVRRAEPSAAAGAERRARETTRDGEPSSILHVAHGTIYQEMRCAQLSRLYSRCGTLHFTSRGPYICIQDLLVLLSYEALSCWSAGNGYGSSSPRPP